MDIFSNEVLAGVVEQIVPQYGFLTRTFFPDAVNFDSETVDFDVRKGSRRIAPFVSPYVQGQIVEKTGFQTYSLRPAYIKDKRVFDGNAPFKRGYGERIGGNLSPRERQLASIRIETQDQIDMLNRRIEVMAGQVLSTGTLTIEGELYPRVDLDFGRDVALTVPLSGSGEWGDTGVKPLALMQTWSQTVFSKSGVRPTRAVMTLDAYQLFIESDAVVKILDRTRANNTLSGDVVEGDDGWYAGSIGGFDVYVYGGKYVDPLDNTEKNILPAYSVILGGPQMKGYRAYGAIRDEAAGLQAMEYFQKSWLVEDPAVRYLMLQSAPILCPLYPDAVLAATVKA